MSAYAKKPVAITTGLSIQSNEPGCRPGVSSVARNSTRFEKNRTNGPVFSWVWDGVPFARVRPGIYDAVGVNLQGPEFVRRYQRWSVRVGFQLLTEDVEVSAYFNFGRGEAPRFLRAGRFVEAWTIANGGPPLKGECMDAAIFLESGRMFTVQVEDARIDPNRAPKAEEQIYSRVKRIVRASFS